VVSPVLLPREPPRRLVARRGPEVFRTRFAPTRTVADRASHYDRVAESGRFPASLCPHCKIPPTPPRHRQLDRVMGEEPRHPSAGSNAAADRTPRGGRQAGQGPPCRDSGWPTRSASSGAHRCRSPQKRADGAETAPDLCAAGGPASTMAVQEAKVTTRPSPLPRSAGVLCERWPGPPPCRLHARAWAGCSAQGRQTDASRRPSHAARSGGG